MTEFPTTTIPGLEFESKKRSATHDLNGYGPCMMTPTTMPIEITTGLDTDDARWRAVMRRDRAAEGRFVYSVRTTGVYCRPTCAARRALRANVEFYQTPADAERAGFRACKRCKPNEIVSRTEYASAVALACQRIADAADSPDLEALARAANMSRSHFHRVFRSLTGLTPKAYANAHRAQRVRAALSHSPTVTSAMYGAGFNSSGRFYSTSPKLLGMKPTQYRAGGSGASIRFAVGECSLGSILVAATEVGICAIALGDDADGLLRDLQDRFPKADLIGGDKAFERMVAKVIRFVERPSREFKLPLHVQGTAFQQRVWQKLCEIPCGQTWTYSQLARDLGEPKANRAVAHACAANPIAVAIPCHRVVRIDGSLSGYRWGIERKAKLLKAEGC